MALQSTDLQIQEAIERGDNVLIIGEGGTGKTFLLRMLFSKLSAKKECAMTATTGAAAILVEGKTLHSWAGIGLGQDEVEKLVKKILNNSTVKTRWRTTNILFLDEVSMLGASLLEKLNEVAQKVRGSKKPFGGLQLVFCGDILQLCPVKDKFFFEASCYTSLNFGQYELKDLKRFTDKDYATMLSSLRLGKVSDIHYNMLKKREEEYENVKEDMENWQIKPTILYAKRADVDYENMKALEKIDEVEYEFEATDSFKMKDKDNERQIEMLKIFLENRIPQKISLKKGAQVMLKYNINSDVGLVNGSRGVVMDIDIKSDTVYVLFLNGTIFPVTPITWKEKDKEKSKAYRTQIPLILATSITMHKCQGITLDFVICNLAEIFEYGQAYVALSRVKGFSGLFLTGLSKDVFRAHPKALKFLGYDTKTSKN